MFIVQWDARGCSDGTTCPSEGRTRTLKTLRPVCDVIEE